MGQIVVFAVLVVAAVAVAFVLKRRQRPAPPTQPLTTVPAQLDRRDFDRPEAPWLVAAFSSSTCLSCADTWEKARLLESDTVAVQDIDAVERRDLHQRYGITGVPVVVVADADGVVQAAFVGPPSAADLWASLANLRNSTK